MHDQYCRVITPEPIPTEETEEVCYLLRQAMDLRCWQGVLLFKEYLCLRRNISNILLPAQAGHGPQVLPGGAVMYSVLLFTTFYI